LLACLLYGVFVHGVSAAANNFGLIVAGSQGAEAPYAVLVWVHGESFEWNAGSSYDGSVLSSVGKIVVVTFNYRLGILGEYKKLITHIFSLSFFAI